MSRRTGHAMTDSCQESLPCYLQARHKGEGFQENRTYNNRNTCTYITHAVIAYLCCYILRIYSEWVYYEELGLEPAWNRLWIPCMYPYTGDTAYRYVPQSTAHPLPLLPPPLQALDATALKAGHGREPVARLQLSRLAGGGSIVGLSVSHIIAGWGGRVTLCWGRVQVGGEGVPPAGGGRRLGGGGTLCWGRVQVGGGRYPLLGEGAGKLPAEVTPCITAVATEPLLGRRTPPLFSPALLVPCIALGPLPTSVSCCVVLRWLHRREAHLGPVFFLHRGSGAEEHVGLEGGSSSCHCGGRGPPLAAAAGAPDTAVAV